MSSVRALVALAVGLAAAGCSSSDASSSGSSGSSGDDGSDAPSFKADVYPIILASCSLTACHGSKASHLNIYLPNNASDIYTALQGASPTTSKPFVKAGDPDGSYVMIKMDGKQTQGTAMPPPPDALVAQKDRDTLRAWIKAGAKND